MRFLNTWLIVCEIKWINKNTEHSRCHRPQILLKAGRVQVEVTCYLAAIYGRVAVTQNCSNLIHLCHLLPEKLLIFFEVQKSKLGNHFAKPPLHGLANTAHPEVEGLLGRRQGRTAVRLQEQWPQGVCWISIDDKILVSHQSLQLRVQSTVTEYSCTLKKWCWVNFFFAFVQDSTDLGRLVHRFSKKMARQQNKQVLQNISYLFIVPRAQWQYIYMKCSNTNQRKSNLITKTNSEDSLEAVGHTWFYASR